MLSEFARERAMSALILGFFAAAWFGWAQDQPPTGWVPPLTAGTIVSLLVVIAGGVLAWRHRHGPSALAAPGAMARFGLIVGIEFGVAAAGAVILTVIGQPASIAPFVCLVVGVHFWPLAAPLRDPSLIGLGLVMVAIAAVGVIVARQTGIAPSAIVGTGAGVALLTAAVGAAIAAVR